MPSPAPPTDDTRRDKEETHAWIVVKTHQDSKPPTYAEIQAWCRRSKSTVERWVSAWKKAGVDPRDMGAALGEDLQQAAPAQIEPTSPASPGKTQTESPALRLLRRLTPAQEKAARLLAQGKTTTEAGAEVGFNRKTVWGWTQMPEFGQLVDQVRLELHQEALALTKFNAQKGALLIRKTLQMLEHQVDEAIQAAVEGEDGLDHVSAAQLARAATAAAKTAMEHGGLPKTERVEATVTGEVEMKVDLNLMAREETSLEGEYETLLENLRSDEEVVHHLKAQG